MIFKAKDGLDGELNGILSEIQQNRCVNASMCSSMSSCSCRSETR